MQPTETRVGTTTTPERSTEPRAADWIIRLFGGGAPLGFQAGDANLYRYVKNGPTNATDASGLQANGPAVVVGTASDNVRATWQIDLDRLAFMALAGGSRARRWGTRPQQLLYWSCPTLGIGNLLPHPPHRESRYDVTSGRRFTACITTSREIVGVTGAGPCVGLILVPPRPAAGGVPDNTYAFHFTANDNPVATLESIGRTPAQWAGYTAVLCGAHISGTRDVDLTAAHTLSMVFTALEVKQISVRAYVAAPNVHVDGLGNIYWTTPLATSLTGY